MEILKHLSFHEKDSLGYAGSEMLNMMSTTITGNNKVSDVVLQNSLHYEET